MGKALVLVLSTLLTLVTGSGASWAQQFPAKPIRLIVPFGAGGSSDVSARILADAMRVLLGQPFVVENRPGAGGTVGTNYAANAPADGYTLVLAGTPNFAINIFLYGALAGDVAKNFVPIALVYSSPNVLLANGRFSSSSLKDLLAIAKREPKLFIAIGGFGSSGHLAGALLESLTDVQFDYVAYANPITPVVSGEVKVGLYSLPAALPHIQSGELKALAVTSKRRNPIAPDIPSVAELGFPDFEAVAWNGLAAPAGTPKDVVRILSASARRVVAQPAIQEKLMALGNEITPMDSDEFASFVSAERQKWAEMVRRTGAKPN